MERFNMKKNWKYYAAGGMAASVLSYLAFLLFRKFKGKLGLGKNLMEPIALSKSEAMQRSKLIRNLKYTIFLQLRFDTFNPAKNVYDGVTLIEFDLETLDDIFLDFKGNIKKLLINEEEILNFNHSNERIHLNKEKLRLKGNRVYVHYLNHYSTESKGIRQYIDPEDENPYVYTNFEPFYAHFMFPCFDQPNLKAPFKLYVACPNNWNVISSADAVRTIVENEAVKLREKEINSSIFNIPTIKENFLLAEFETTPVIATYTFAVCAGTYEEIEDFTYDKADNLLPMKLYVRASVSKVAENSFTIFQTVKEVKKWFRENLTQSIPFLKTDFVFVPHFKQVAMENIGCITFDDNFLEPQQTPLETAYFHSLISHELCHTYFGNYVTPEWWDDLWLNESFATFLSYLCLKQISEKNMEEMDQFKSVWLLFSKHKGKAVAYDQYKTTHKIRDLVDDTRQAEVVFDNITYYKGASILRYFYYVTGHELFFKALSNYVTKFHMKNANFSDFKDILKNLTDSRNQTSPLNVIDPFLNNPGIIRLETNLKLTTNNIIEEFTITQNPSTNAPEDIFYRFRFNILLIYEGKEVILNDIEIENTKVNKIKLDGLEKPLAIVLNAGDWTYFKQNFDETSKEYLINNTHKIKDPVNRLVVAKDLNEMIKEGKLEVESYVKFSVNLLKYEKEDFIVDQVIKTAIYASTKFVLFEQQGKLRETLFNFIREDLFYKHKQIRKTLLNYLVDLIDFANDKQIRFLFHLLTAEKTTTNLLRGDSEILDNVDLTRSLDLSYLDEPLKLRLLETIAESVVLSDEEKKHFTDLIASIEVISSRTIGEKKKGNLLTGKRMEQMTLEACKPIKSLKDKIYYMIVNKDAALIDDEYEAYMRGFARQSQYALLKEYFKYKFFEDIEYVKNYWGEDYACRFFKHLNPGFVISETVLKSFVRLSRKINKNEKKLRAMVEKTISQIMVNLRVAKKSQINNSK